MRACAAGAWPDQALRRARDRRRPVLRAAARRVLWPAGPQRRGQDHHLARLAGPDAVRRRGGRGAGPRRAGAGQAGAGAPGRGAAARQPGPRLHRGREPAGIRPLLRPERRAGAGQAAAIAGVRGPGRQGRCPHRRALRRHEAAPDAGARAHQRSRPHHHGRADHRVGSAGAPPDLGAPEGAAGARQDHPADHAFHGRGRTPVPPARRDRPRPADYRRRAPGPDRALPGAAGGRGLWR